MKRLIVIVFSFIIFITAAFIVLFKNKQQTFVEKPVLEATIMPANGIIVKVVPGDTVYTLAKKYHSDPQKIVNYPNNEFADLDTFSLTVGQSIFIPDGVKID